MSFTKRPSFDSRTYRAADFVTGRLPRRDDAGLQPHERDDFVLRGPEITFHDGRGEVSLGHADFLPSVLRAVAVEHLEMVPAALLAAAEEAGRTAAHRLSEAHGALREARDLAAGLIIERNDLEDALRAAEQALTEREADLQAALARADAAPPAARTARKASAR